MDTGSVTLLSLCSLCGSLNLQLETSWLNFAAVPRRTVHSVNFTLSRMSKYIFHVQQYNTW
ncbi:hypothetical protein PR003_g9567 [Phytophthora rubi]|uniref:Uncharacterized protein n=1 Tax=Phytophthora rubi TaxID=129364 RepID=A0A6A4FG08_9STRA|nr:hypothetical protein PR002_g8500 [Phytophthora rubi]KAE9036160.1 hypothetical protein PR001_g8961 [Phytophthora rubi]KAE9342275.1 hypothetical protein PR003_g9567 [Phytophthora rubi]